MDADTMAATAATADYQCGFILTSRVIYRNQKAVIELWVSTDNGPYCLYTPTQDFSFFVSSHQYDLFLSFARQFDIPVAPQDKTFMTLERQTVRLIKVSKESALQRVRTVCTQNNIVLYEADIKLPDRFLMERFIYGALAFPAPREKVSAIQNVHVVPASYKPTLSYLALDIECDENENLFSIAVAGPSVNSVFIIPPPGGMGEQPKSQHFSLIQTDSESALLTALEKCIENADPDIILGWNIKQFDFSVLERRARRLKRPLLLGRNNTPVRVHQWQNGQTQVEIPGRCVVDGIESLKTMTYHFDSFSLDHVADNLLGEKKLIQEPDKLAAIKHQYQHSPASLAEYNYQDCVLVNRIAEQTNMLDYLVLRSNLTGLELSRPGGSVAAFLNLYLPRLHRAGFVSGIRPQNGGLASPGGYVMSSRPGLYRNVLVLDFKSLYPSIIRTFCIDPMGLSEGLNEPDSAIPGFKGAIFSRTRHFLPDIISRLWAQRDEAKRQHDAPRSQAIKILMNSFYGVLGSGGCPFFDPRLASSITLRGHEIMQTTAKWIEKEGFTVIYGDTDSTFVHVKNADSSDEAMAVGRQLQETINQRWQEVLKQKYDLPCYLEIEFETHFEQFFMPTIRGSSEGSKKRYAGITQKNGKQEMIFKGLESVRSDWTDLAKQFQRELYSCVFYGRPVKPLLVQLIRDVQSGKKDHLLIYSKRLRKPLAAYTKSKPPHVKAALFAEKVANKTGTKAEHQLSGRVRYVITTAGPQPANCITAPLNYDHYIERQIKPIADNILPFIGQQFTGLTEEQLPLF